MRSLIFGEAILIFSGFLAVIYLLYQCYKGERLVYQISHPPRMSAANYDSIPFSIHRFYFSSADKLTLSAINIMPCQNVKGTVIVCHYLGGSKASVYPYMEPLLNSGYHVVAFDYPNHGESMSRKSSRYTLEDDMKRFLIALKERGINGPYITYGLSMGAGIAISAADVCEDIKGIIVDSGPLIHVKDYFCYVLNHKGIKNIVVRAVFLFQFLYIAGFYKMSIRMKKRLKNLELPILIIHGKRDRTISYQSAEYVYSFFKAQKAKLVFVERAYHLTNRVLLGEKYDKLIIDFVEKYMTMEEH